MRLPTKEKAKVSGKRGSRPADVICVEGQFVTYRQIGAQENLSEDAVRRRLAKLRKQEGGITWAKIRGE
jgi:hypothetical protein